MLETHMSAASLMRSSPLQSVACDGQ